MVYEKLTDNALTQMLIPKRFVPPIPPELQGKNVTYIFDSSDSFLLTYDELVEIISKARSSNSRMIPVLGTVNNWEVIMHPHNEE